MKWIKVTDDLPNQYFVVLVCDKYKYTCEGYYLQGKWYHQINNEQWSEFNNCTHWMPMPLPPNE